MAEVKPAVETFAKIKVIGVGGSGGSAVNRMIKAQIKGVEFIVANTDVQALHYSLAPTKLHLGKGVTRGLGAGMNPEVGKAAAEESQNEIRAALNGADMVFVTCGLGGGTGSGAAPVIAEIARDIGALTVAVVTKPFSFEGAQRSSIAHSAFEKLAANVDSIIAIPNDRVLSIIEKKTSLLQAFDTVDEVLRQGVQGISESITVPGIINVDFADVKAIMAGTGSSLMGIGRANGEDRAVAAAKQAIASPLLDMSIDGAKGILFTVTGGNDLSMHEVSEAAKVITANADPDARVIFGTVIDETLGDDIKICVIATGFDGGKEKKDKASTEKNFYAGNRFLSREKGNGGFGSSMPDNSLPKIRVKNTEIVPPSAPVARDEEEQEEEVEEEEHDEEGVVVAEEEPPAEVAVQQRPRPEGFVRRFVPERAPAPVPLPPIQRRRQPVVATGEDEEEDLDVPAFLRRTMGS